MPYAAIGATFYIAALKERHERLYRHIEDAAVADRLTPLPHYGFCRRVALIYCEQTHFIHHASFLDWETIIQEAMIWMQAPTRVKRMVWRNTASTPA